MLYLKLGDHQKTNLSKLAQSTEKHMIENEGERQGKRVV